MDIWSHKKAKFLLDKIKEEIETLLQAKKKLPIKYVKATLDKMIKI